MASLNEFLTEVANAIREKKGTTDKINAQDFSSEILSIEGGGSSGGATIEMGGGTPIPTDGSYVENIYFNMDLSVDEVVGVLSQLTYNSDEFTGVIYASSDMSTAVMVGYMNGLWLIMDVLAQNIIFSSAINEEIGTTFEGWNPDITNPIIINNTLMTTEEMQNTFGISGLDTSLISSVVGISENFEPVLMQLSGTYQSSSIVEKVTENGTVSFDIKEMIDEGKIPLKASVTVNIPKEEPNKITSNNASPVPNSGYVEKVYFNTSLSVEEINNILAQLPYEYEYFYETGKVYYILWDGSTKLLYATYDSTNNRYEINSRTDVVSTIFNGSYKISSINTSITINFDTKPYVYENGNYTMIGTENDKLMNLISFTPFESVEKEMAKETTFDGSTLNIESNQLVDISTLIDNGQIPLKVNVNVPAPIDMLQQRANVCGDYLFAYYSGDNLDFASKLDYSKVTSSAGMFRNCENLTEVIMSNTSNFSYCGFMFYNCKNLVTVRGLDLSSAISESTVSGGETFHSMFTLCNKLTNLELTNIRKDLSITSELLTFESLINTIKELKNENLSRTLTIGTVNLEKIANTYVKFTDTTQTEISVHEKGEVEICESTDERAMTLQAYANLKNWTIE